MIEKIITYLKATAVSFVTIIDTTIVLVILKFRGNKFFHPYTQFWAKRILAIVGVKVKIEGLENIKRDTTYVFTVNHSSFVDIPILQAYLPDPIRIIYKKELEKIPVFGYGLYKSPYISIDRSDPKNAMASLDSAVEAVKTGDSVVIFPEGTRSLDGNIGEFKRGAFLMASRSQKTIIPITLIGAAKIFPPDRFVLKSGTVKMIIGKPIEGYGTSKAEEKALSESIRNWMIETKEKYK